jgi:monoamine oxidase
LIRATGLYDQAFTESVMDSLDFGFPNCPDWVCVEGGTSTVITKMLNGIKKTPSYGRRVTKIARDGNDHLQVFVARSKTPHRYSHVISTIPLSCLRLVDLTKAELDYAQRTALRSLHYDASCKVGIKFRTKWWHNDVDITRAGQGKTDEPVRVCAYPSYGIDDDPSKPAVLIASYTWAQDAQRIGGLVQGQSTPTEALLVDLVLQGLTRLHPTVTYDFLKSQVVEHFVHDWYRDENAIGAFALFGPGQFSNLYPGLTRPAAGGRLHFAGEAASCHHAWVEGALSSAIRAVIEVLVRNGLEKNVSQLANEFKIPNELEMKTVKWQVFLGSRSAAEKD